MQVTIIIPGAPRTKKNSPNVFPMIKTEGVRKLWEALGAALGLDNGTHGAAVRAIMSLIKFSVQPSEGYTQWFDLIYATKRDSIQNGLRTQGVRLPILTPVSIEARVYRDADRGDWSGYTQAIGDAIQADRWRCGHCRKKTISLGDCPHCRSSVCNMEHERKGLGIIGDDSQIEHWDGTRLYLDPRRPRVELIVRTLQAKGQGSLLTPETESTLV